MFSSSKNYYPLMSQVGGRRLTAASGLWLWESNQVLIRSDKGAEGLAVYTRPRICFGTGLWLGQKCSNYQSPCVVDACRQCMGVQELSLLIFDLKRLLFLRWRFEQLDEMWNTENTSCLVQIVSALLVKMDTIKPSILRLSFSLPLMASQTDRKIG